MFYFVHYTAYETDAIFTRDRVYDEITRDYKVLVKADNFADAVAQCQKYDDCIEKITLIEPITDFTILVINEDIEKAIKDIDDNSF